MKRYAMLVGTTVSNILVTENKEETESALNCVLIEITHENPAAIGWQYDQNSSKFVEPLEE